MSLKNKQIDIDLFVGNCLETMYSLPSKHFDMVFADLPYGTTNCKWDAIIPFEQLWSAIDYCTKDHAALVFTASQPFTSALVSSNYEMFRYEWIYQKTGASNFAQAKYAPMKEHESVLVFGKNKPKYYPIKEERKGTGLSRSKYAYSDKSRKAVGEFMGQGINKGTHDSTNDAGNDELRYPSSVQLFNNRAKGDRGHHPTQKPVALLEYLINTYTKEGESVLDPVMGSGTTGVACANLGRSFTGIDQDINYYDIAQKRIENALQQ
jgi:site-specific DNA-methyltransferase (adenine-specific)